MVDGTMRKTLYTRQKGKQMRSSGSWKTTKGEQKLVNAAAVFFAISVIAVLVSPFVHKRWFLIASIVCCAAAFIFMFAVLFGLVFRKSRQQPMETHYYDVDYRYNALNGETDDKTREISTQSGESSASEDGEFFNTTPLQNRS